MRFFLIMYAGQTEAEVINCTTGKDELGKPSRISKQRLFRKFFSLLGKLETIDDADRNQCRHYLDAKSSVQDYSVSYRCITLLRTIFIYIQDIDIHTRAQKKKNCCFILFSFMTACQTSIEGCVCTRSAR